jgi:hypothetical protein
MRQPRLELGCGVIGKEEMMRNSKRVCDKILPRYMHVTKFANCAGISHMLGKGQSTHLHTKERLGYHYLPATDTCFDKRSDGLAADLKHPLM